ncbi:hypothetical protein QOZ80_8AG0629710 [Eleusine coracana subsp. coracana]|nr:hypothetical protein QOZ80_8BG0658610 [Eleusine coracana subsp. coracana]KAK3123380.1 hypothetical protein QOZ80_8AG0629710 [Eleusine coracana subsp. coracana]
MLSRYGIRAFPTLFLVNSTVRVRYHGSRTMNSLAMFYKNVTGMDPMSVDVTSLEKMADTINIIDSDKNTEQEDSLLVNACVKQAWRMRLHELNRLFPGLS